LKPGYSIVVGIAGCAPGYSTFSGGCKACDAGYYSTQFGSASCVACPAGQASNAGASACYPDSTTASTVSGEQSVSGAVMNQVVMCTQLVFIVLMCIIV
jgi:hypothetical protein